MSPAYSIHDGSLRNGGVTRDKPNSKFDVPGSKFRQPRTVAHVLPVSLRNHAYAQRIGDCSRSFVNYAG